MERQPINGELGATMDELNEGIADLNQGMEEMEGLWMEFDRVKRILTGTSGDHRESLVHMLVVTLLVGPMARSQLLCDKWYGQDSRRCVQGTTGAIPYPDSVNTS